MKIEIILAMSLVANIFFASVFGYLVWRKGGVRYIYAKITRRKPMNYTYENRVSLFRHLGANKDDTYFIGHSTTSFAEWSELISPSVKNRSISGEISSGFHNRIDTIVNGLPHKVFLMIGINDLLRGIPIDLITKTYESILSTFATYSPESTIYICSVLPIHRQRFVKHILVQRSDIMPALNDVKILNDALTSLALKCPMAKYVDLASLTHNGELRDDCTIDGIHLDGKGLIELAGILKKYVEE
jgi:lysophospholipase L1-like esterase